MEEIKRRGDKAIENWIIESLKYKKCTIVLVGSETSNRKWVKREIELTWEAGKGLFGINIHNMKDKDGRQCRKGTNPFGKVNHSDGRTPLSSIVRLYDPPYSDSKDVYAYISDNIESWVDNAINLRAIY